MRQFEELQHAYVNGSCRDKWNDPLMLNEIIARLSPYAKRGINKS